MSYHFQKTDDGSHTLFNEVIGEACHSQSGAMSESRHVYLEPLVERDFFAGKSTIRVLDVGFGLGLNTLCYFDFFLTKMSMPLQIVSLENNADVLSFHYTREHVGDDVVSAQALEFLSVYKKEHCLKTKNIQAQLVFGQAQEFVRGQHEKFDIVLQDAFSPKKNPECWSLEYFQNLSKMVKVGGVLLTYSVSRSVCEILSQNGFAAIKISGFGKKREQLLAWRV